MQVGRQTDRKASRQASRWASKRESKETSKQVLGRHSVGAMPWRGLFKWIDELGYA